jgi:6-pyruvoyltetrahydropterin/6-carboxytetrahydropterin synthase
MFSVGVVSQFEAAHRLRGDFGPATRTHGHTYRIELRVAGEQLRDDGTLCDIGTLRAMLDNLIALLNYRDLDEIEGFRGHNTTAEAVAGFFFDGLKKDLVGQALEELSVTVWESPQAYAECSGRLK